MPESLPVGCTLPSSGAAADPTALGGLAQTAEELGFDSIWISDHVVIPERISSAYPYSVDGAFPTSPTQAYLEPLTTLGYLAGVTQRVRLGIAVLILPYRHPLLTAKMIATLDNLSHGRVDLGIGVGWMREEFLALGLPEEVYTHRGSATDEHLRVMTAVWTEDVAGFGGRFYQFERLGAHPHPVQKPHPPIWIGGHTGPALRRVARYGDGWLPIGGRPPADLPPSEVAACISRIREQAAEAGRDPSAIRVCFDTTIDFVATDGRPFSGSSESIAEQLSAYVEAGADSLVVSFGRQPPSDYQRSLQRFAAEVRPLLRERLKV
ncbi:MAG: LLM class F420-dependent oxidoreductase [Chloroflexi bacterium]|nr:LLM class F420-dependent oxidoreductase [Chloroflexota bacterium]MBV9898784.1 LLM class F420-dependent oxidoreductase [Chloroflexota bacterium]